MGQPSGSFVVTLSASGVTGKPALVSIVWGGYHRVSGRILTFWGLTSSRSVMESRRVSSSPSNSAPAHHHCTVQLQYCTFVVRKYFRTFESTEVLSYFRTFEGNLACTATVQRCRAYFRKYFRTLQYFRTFEEKIKVHVYVY